MNSRDGGNQRHRTHLGSLALAAVLASFLPIFFSMARAEDENQPQEDVPCTWGEVKCCFTDLCECCPREGKGTGKTLDEPACYLIELTAEDLPLSGYSASKECLLRYGPWAIETIRECQGELVQIELQSEEDLRYYSYRYMKCEGSEPYLVRSHYSYGTKSSTNRSSWGRVKMMYR